MANAADKRSDPGSAARRKRTRVLVVGPVTAVGGIGQVARMSVSAMDARRFDIATCDTTKDTPTDRSLASALWSHAKRLINLIRGIRTHQPDVVHLHTCSYLTFFRTLIDVAICRCMGRNYVLHIHGGLFDEFLASLRGWKKAWVSNSLRHAGRVIVLGERWRTNLMRRVAGMDIAVLPNAIELAQIVGSGASTDRTLGVMFIGDLSEPKRPEDLIVAYAALPSPMRKQFPLHIVGGGSPQRRGHLRSLAQRLNIEDRVVFHGSLPHDQVTRLLRSADIFVLPSRAEGQPIALLEAMAADTASIVTNVGAIPETVTDGIEALIVEPCHPLRLANGMRDLLANPAKRRSMGCAARLRVENDFSTERFVRCLAAIWDGETRRSDNKNRIPIPRLASSSFRSIL
jgi:glycosyltransferase involved in cell wall biosynthesis